MTPKKSYKKQKTSTKAFLKREKENRPKVAASSQRYTVKLYTPVWKTMRAVKVTAEKMAHHIQG